MLWHVVDVVAPDLVSDQSLFVDADGNQFIIEGCLYCDYRETCLELGECIA